MTILTFKIECESNPHSVNITDWRYMVDCIYYYGSHDSASGTRIIIPDKMIDIMGYTMGMTLKALSDDKIIENVIFSTNHRYHPGWCVKCSGLGKLDWVSSAMQVDNIYSDRYARFFKRNKERVLFYKDSKHVGGHYFGHIFAPVLIEESKSETICKHCCGTGLHLDARHSLFDQMKGLRHRLEEFEWDGQNIPGVT